MEQNNNQFEQPVAQAVPVAPASQPTPVAPASQPTYVNQVAQPVAQANANPVQQPSVVQQEPIVENDSENVEVTVEDKKKNNGEKKFLKSAFTTYLPVTLAIIALSLHFVYGSMLLVDALNIAQLFHVLANGASVAGIIVEAVRQIKNKHFEFNPSLIIVLLTLFIVK